MDNIHHEESPTEHTALLSKIRRSSSSAILSADQIADQIADQRNVSSSSQGFAAMWQRSRFYLIEPTILILVFAYNLSATVWKNQIIYQTCTVIFQHNNSDCRKLATKNNSDYIKSIETEVQSYTVVFFMTNSLLQSIVPALCGAFVGAWSDRFGRKPLLIASFTGYLLFYSLTFIISDLSESFEVNPWFYLIPSIPLSLLGDGVTYSVATFCYISDVSTAKERPYRMTLYEAVIYTGLMFGSLSSGFIYEAYESSTLIFFISAFCIFCATLVVIFLIPESLNARQTITNPNVEQVHTEATGEEQHRREDEEQNASNHKEEREVNENSNNNQEERAGNDNSISNQEEQKNDENPNNSQPPQQQQIENPQGRPNRFRSLFDIDHIKSLYETCFAPREYEKRTVVLLIVGCLLTCAFIVEGSTTVFYLFVREKFQWTVKDFTTYESVSILIPILGNIIGILLLRKIFKMQLLSLAILGLFSQTCSSLMKGFAAINWQLYLAIVLGILKSIVNPMLRTALTNLLPANELGKIFSFTSAIQAFLPFAASPLYAIVYRATLATFPGFFNILNANLFLLAIGLILVILRKKQKYPDQYTTILN